MDNPPKIISLIKRQVRHKGTYSIASEICDGHKLLDGVPCASERHRSRLDQDIINGEVTRSSNDGEVLNGDTVVMIELFDGVVKPIDGSVVSWGTDDTRVWDAT